MVGTTGVEARIVLVELDHGRKPRRGFRALDEMSGLGVDGESRVLSREVGGEMPEVLETGRRRPRRKGAVVDHRRPEDPDGLARAVRAVGEGVEENLRAPRRIRRELPDEERSYLFEPDFP